MNGLGRDALTTDKYVNRLMVKEEMPLQLISMWTDRLVVKEEMPLQLTSMWTERLGDSYMYITNYKQGYMFEQVKCW